MPFEQHKEKNYSKDVQSIYQAGLSANKNWIGRSFHPTLTGIVSALGFPK
jgi:hypothetical protein